MSTSRASWTWLRRFIGDTPFAKHVQNVLEMPNVAAHLIALPAIDSAGHTVESLTQEVRRKMTEGLAHCMSGC